MAAASFRPATGSIPTQPGVYRFRDARGRVIYVGKAKNLRARLSSYFQDIGNLHARTATMVTTAAGVDWTVVNTEVEALQLEYSWIKEFDPRFNVKYRDDKSYPWLAVTVGDEFPRVMVGRGAKRKGTRYFGPYSHAWAIRETVDILLRVFPMRSCSNGVFKRSGQIGRPCLLGYIDKCSAPCVGNISADDHRAIVDDFCDFMAGQTRPFIRRIEREMYAASDRQDFEKAARLRDDLGAMERALEKQAVVLGDGSDVDVIALAEDPLEVAVQVFYVRGGRIRGQRGWVADRVEEGGTPELVEDFLLQLYAGDSDSIPKEILVPELPPDVDTFEQLLGDLRGSRVQIRVPQRGDKKTLQETVASNALGALALHKTKRASDLTTRNRALEEIQQALELDDVPLRIECYDISNLQGTEVVASMVVFEDGLARKSEYRRFVIKGVDGQNDVASMHEVITRRFRRLLDEQARSEFKSPGDDQQRPDARRPRDRPAAEVRLRAGAGRRRRWPAAGGRGAAGARRARHRRHPGGRPGQAARGGLGARPGGPGHPAPLVRGALPAPADPRRGAPLRHHPPPLAAVQVDGREPARRRTRPRRGAPQDPAQALRLAQEAARGRGRRHRPGARHRAHDRGRDQGRGGRDHRQSPDCLRDSLIQCCDGRDRRRLVTTEDATAKPGELVVVTGMTGAGRSTAAKELEDLGYYVIDNLPPGLLKDVVRLVDESKGPAQPVALVIDVRSGAFFDSLAANLAQGATGRHATLVFLEASDEVLVRRQEAARRPHPLQGDGRLLDGLQREREVLAGLRGDADLVIDTSDFNVHQLTDRIADEFGTPLTVRLKVSVVSFGFKYGIPVDTDFMADMRFLPNPHWIPELRPHTGLDAEVADYVLGQQGAAEFVERWVELIAGVAEGYLGQGKRFAQVAIGCTGGKHRSVTVTEEVVRRLQDRGIEARAYHRDLGRE